MGAQDDAGRSMPEQERKAQDVSPDNETAAESLEVRKWNSYVLLANESEVKVLAALEDYIANFPEREFVVPQGEFTYKHPATGGAPLRGVAASLQEAMANAASEPVSDLDNIALAYAESLEKLWQVLVAADSYYTSKEYKKDNFAGGKELHDRIVESAMAYAPFSDEFSQALVLRDENMMRESVAKLHKQNMPLHAAVLNVILEARAMERELHRQNLYGTAGAAKDAVLVKDTDSFDAVAYAAQADVLVKKVLELETWLSNDAQKEKEEITAEAANALRDSAGKLASFVRQLPDHLQGAVAEQEADYAALFGGLMNAYIAVVNESLQ